MKTDASTASPLSSAAPAAAELHQRIGMLEAERARIDAEIGRLRVLLASAAAPASRASGSIHQLDIFADSDDVRCRNAAIDALLAGSEADAAAALQAWRDASPDDPLLADAVLLAAEGACPGTADTASGATSTPAPEPASACAAAVPAIRAARDHLRQHLTPAAQRLLGDDASRWLAPRWRGLAQRAAKTSASSAWEPDLADVHPTTFWLQAQQWPAAMRAVESIASWRRIPQPLLWMATARWHSGDHDGAWPLLAEALCLVPARAAPLLRELVDNSASARSVARFDEQFEPDTDDDWTWLPAWLLIDQPLMARVLEGASPAVDRPGGAALQQVLALLRLEAEGRQRDNALARQRLRDIEPRLLACYLRSR